MIESQATTMKDIAERFGVSISTVSRALSGSPRVRKDKRDAICQYAAQHNFYPNDIAKSLRLSKRQPVKVIGVIVPEFTHYYFSSVLTGIEEVTPHYHIIVETRGGMDALIVETELRPEAFRDSFEAMDALRARIAEKLKGTLLVAPEVRLVEPGGIERAIGKAKHVDDRREK